MKQPDIKKRGAKEMDAIEEMAHVGSWFWDLRDDTRSWSDEFYKICGLPPGDERLNAETVLNFIHPEDREAAMESVQFAIENKLPYNHEKRLVRPDGSFRHVIANGRATYNSKGEPLTMFGTISDVTKLKKTESLLKRERETLSAYLDAAASIFLIINIDHNIELINRKGCEILGYSREEIIGKNWFQRCIPRKEQKELSQLFDKIVDGAIKPPDVFENWVVTKEKERKLIRWRNAVVKDENNQVSGLISSGVDVTEEVLALKRLRYSEEKNKAILEALPDVLTIHNKKGTVLEIYIPDVSYLIAPRSDLEGENVKNLFFNEMGEKLKKNIKYVLRSKKMKTIEVTSPVARGTEDYECRLVPLNKDRVLIVSRNISEKKDIQDQLRLRNNALAVAGNGIIIVDAQQPDLPIIYSNAAFTRMTGYTQDEILGKNCRFLQNDDRDQDEIALVSKAINEGEPCRVTLRNYHKDGTLFWNDLSITPLYDKSNRLNYFIGVQNDVTDIQQTKKQLEEYAEKLEEKVAERTKEIEATVQKLVETNLDLEDQIQITQVAEDKAQQSQAQFAAIAKNFPKGLIVVFNADFELVYVEGEELKRVNLKKSDFEGKRVDDISFFSKTQIDSIKEDVRKTIQGKNLSFEIAFQNNFYAVNATPLKSNGEGIVWALFVYNNITEQKKVQAELAKALKVERELNELKSRFISMASHEFRTPLSAILSSAILIGKQNGPGKEERREKHVERIRTHVKHLVVILNDFLSLSKLEEGKVRVKPQHFELIQFCKIIIDEMVATKKEGQLIRFKHTAIKINTFLDPKLLSHILINLLSNALKYSGESQEVILEIRQEFKSVFFNIIDNGIGIPEKEQGHLFERFFRAENATNIQGTGLGLHIVKQYTELMVGTVSFTSKPGKGSTFTVKLPLKSMDHDQNIIN